VEILEALWVLFEMFGGILLDAMYAWSTFRDTPRSEIRRMLAMLVCLLVGLGLGAVWVWLVPRRILPGRTMFGVSMFIAPIVAGFVMAQWGRYRQARGRATSQLATWYGGAGFGLGLAIARFLGTQ
jgi:hypothetical protein